jgi:hypothetical protein
MYYISFLRGYQKIGPTATRRRINECPVLEDVEPNLFWEMCVRYRVWEKWLTWVLLFFLNYDITHNPLSLRNVCVLLFFFKN